jgi:subtilisin-like proprotein convertase family protein
MYHIRSQPNKTSPQQQKKPQKIFKHMETEQHTAERPVGDWRNKERNKKVPRI